MNTPCQRHLFDIPDEIAYFNCAYNSPQLKESTRRLLAGVAEKSHPWARSAASFFADAESIRRLASEVFGGDADGYAVIPAASYGLSTAARAIEPTLQAGDTILLIDEEFPSNVLPWQRVAAETGAVLRTVPTPLDGDWTTAILAQLDASTRVLAASACHWTNGARIDLAPIAAACRKAACALVLDLTQSLGAMPFALDEVQPDFLVAAGYKWLLGPYGCGLLWVAPSWRESRPLEETWLARSGAEDFASLVRYSPDYQPGARRFDMGEKCNPNVLPGLIAALEQLGHWGVSNIAASLSSINTAIAGELQSLGFRLPPPAQLSPHMFGAELPTGFAPDLLARLRAQDIYISQRGRALRFAPHLHVSKGDVDRLLGALRGM